MPNQHVFQRLAGIQSILNGVHQSGVPMSAASKGAERAAFIGQFLSQAMPSPYRFGTGDATDAVGNLSGELDVVVEYPFAPSLPGLGASRLYLAEGVAAVIEVKSDAANQWKEVESTAAKLAGLNRNIHAVMSIGGRPGPKIPLFVAGYTGWKQQATVQEHLQQTPSIAGVLIIDPGIFVSTPAFQGITATGPWALWGLIASLHQCLHTLLLAQNDPLDYAK